MFFINPVRIFVKYLALTVFFWTFNIKPALAIEYFSFSGHFDTGNLAGIDAYGSYSFDEGTEQLLSFTQSYSGLATVHTLADFSSITASTPTTFSLQSPILQIAFGPGDPDVPNSRSDDVKWYDWSVWKGIDYPHVPMTGSATGLFTVVPVPEPGTYGLCCSLVLLFGVGLRYRNKRLRDYVP